MSSKVVGKVCPKHPDNGGVRYRANHNCTECHAEYVRLKRSKSTAPKGAKVTGSVCKRHPELEGLRYASSRCCLACNGRDGK